MALTAACDRSDEGVAPDARPPVILIGIDGAEWSVIEDMVARGELPGFRRMMQEGIHGHLLNPGPQVSPVVWTTFATGHFAREHGILDFVHPYTEGAKRPVDASLRQRPALWNLVDAEGGDATVIGYFVSHPAEPIDGVIVTDRAWQGLERSVWPSDLEPLAATHREAVRSDRDELFARFLPWDYAPAQADDAESPYQQAARLVRGRIDRHILSEEFLRRMTTELLDRPGDLFVTYFRLVDIASHSVWRYHEGGDWEQAPDPEIERLLGGVVA
ncbi:MAG: alkaline phosphatase family protein, partial [Wenzhouxiangellaceae bacterium]|nr:alkaline phosphatase family protein [Wenzhouxiangellaceae bacterium]